MPEWLFAYGSLIWRPGFAYLERRPAVLPDHVRQFWQGSHDHRGTPQSPGRVVTLVPAPGRRCLGMAYRLDPVTRDEVLRVLDHREKNGYERRELTLMDDAGESFVSLVYLAPAGNFAWLGEAAPASMAAQIAASHGPSGSNAEYLRELVVALERLGARDDEHLFDLHRRVTGRVKDSAP